MNFRNKQLALKRQREIQAENIRIIKENIQKRDESIKKHNEIVKILNNYNKINIPFQLKECYNSIIPLNLYTCWHTKDLPPLMRENYELLVKGNPKIKFHLYDEEDCRKFISENFDEKVLNAYDSLILIGMVFVNYYI